jgi:sarcosine oxidase subunit beta
LRADAVVIGGGIVGVSAAYQLAMTGLQNVVVVERKQLGAGATGKSGALVRCHYANLPETLLTLHSLRIFTEWEDRVGFGSPGFEPIGFLQVVAPEDEPKLRANVAAQQAAGVETLVVDRQDLREIEPLLRTDDVDVAAFEPNAGYADPNATLYGFAEAAVAHGARIFTHTPALSVVLEGGRVVGVETASGTIETERVLIAAGSWANNLLAPLGIDLGLQPVRTQVAIFRWPAAVDPRRGHRVIIDAINHSWLRPEGRNATLIGAERSVGDIDPDNLDEGISPKAIATARDVLAARLPVFHDATMRGGWAGTYMRSPDGHPIIDRAPEIEGLWLMTGDSGTSFKTAPAIGICLAEWMTEGCPRLMDLTPFRASRFAGGEPWLDATAYGDDRVLTVSR